jgi:hypothetical protein
MLSSAEMPGELASLTQPFMAHVPQVTLDYRQDCEAADLPAGSYYLLHELPPGLGEGGALTVVPHIL